jgi:hypothetical protein
MLCHMCMVECIFHVITMFRFYITEKYQVTSLPLRNTRSVLQFPFNIEATRKAFDLHVSAPPVISQE